MKREVVQDFLNLPGIAGVALIDGRSRPFFCGLDQTLSAAQKDTLAQGVQQVMATTLVSFDRFEFQFVRYQVHLHKLEGLVLLILGSANFDVIAYQQQIKQIKIELQADLANAIATFRLMSGTITLSKQDYWTQSSLPAEQASKPPDHNPQEIVNALNQLSQFATRYLGATISSNYWKATRPAEIIDFEIDRAACLRFTGTSLDEQQIRVWAASFVDRCATIIRDLPLLLQQDLEPHQYRLLFISPKP